MGVCLVCAPESVGVVVALVTRVRDTLDYISYHQTGTDPV